MFTFLFLLNFACTLKAVSNIIPFNFLECLFQLASTEALQTLASNGAHLDLSWNLKIGLIIKPHIQLLLKY
jgi:hypothetical protein